jgi:DNA-binding response OmpR family regulator
VTQLSVLLVEDDEPLARALSVNLEAEGWQVRAAHTGESALEAARASPPDIVLLDRMLPDGDGLALCAPLRETRPAPGIIVLTARASEADVVLGLDQGADDYVIKPCRPRELVARVRAVLRRREPAPAPHELVTRGRLRIDPQHRRVWVGADELVLTPTEHELLAVLAREPGRVWARLELLSVVFDSTHAGYARNVDCHVARLRRKLAAAGLEPNPIRTMHRMGYRFEAEP